MQNKCEKNGEDGMFCIVGAKIIICSCIFACCAGFQIYGDGIPRPAIMFTLTIFIAGEVKREHYGSETSKEIVNI